MRRITAATLTLTFTLTALVFTAGPSTATSGPMVCPVPSARFVDSWGAPRDGGARSHQGVDMMAAEGTPIVAPADGQLEQHGTESFYVTADDGTVYFGTHLSAQTGPSRRVTAGEQIGLVGHTGNATAGADHLHFEIHPGGGPAVNPTPATFAACTGPNPAEVAVANAVRFVAAAGGPINWPYTAREAKRLWGAFHPDRSIVKPESTRLAVWLNAVVDLRLRQYALALYVSLLRPEIPYEANWDRVAACESGGNWATNTGNGYYGGAQFSLATWRSVGGQGYPHQNSKAEQIRRAEILRLRSGLGQWPVCGRRWYG